VILFGWHLRLDKPPPRIAPSLFLTEADYAAALDEGTVQNLAVARREDDRIARLVAEFPNVDLVRPADIFCDAAGTCQAHDGRLRFFRDETHFTRHATPLVAERIARQIVEDDRP
jgi:SGNH domain (fused to AT3 domains)